MRTSRFTVEQIAQALKRVEGGVVVGEVCRELGVTETTFYRWKRKFGGISSPELRELRPLRDEAAAPSPPPRSPPPTAGPPSSWTCSNPVSPSTLNFRGYGVSRMLAERASATGSA